MIGRNTAKAAALPPLRSLLRCAPAVVVLAGLIADANRRTDPDLWGHLRFGQGFLARGHLVRRDIYSYSAPGHPWRDHEWLAEAVMALVYDTGGMVTLKLWKLGCSVLTVAFIADAEGQTGASRTTQIAILLAASFGVILQSQFRPQMFTFVLLSALLALLARDNYRRDAPLWLVVPLMALWANLHGGFFIGIASLALYSGVATLCDLAAGAGWRRGVRLGALTIAAAAATLLNPYGAAMWGTVMHALRNPYTRNVVIDWQPLLFAMRAQWHAAHSGVMLYFAVIGMVLALGAAFVAEPRGNDLALVAVAAMMAGAAFISVRNLALAAIAVPGPLARHLALWHAHRTAADSRDEDRNSAPAPWRTMTQLPVLAVSIALALLSGLFSPRLKPDRPYPAGALAFMRAHGLHGNVLAEFGWGEYVIWHTAPRDRVFIDGRYDTVYPLPVIRDYLEFYFDQPGASAVLGRYPHDFVLIGPPTPAAKLMARRTDWRLLYHDSAALLYAPASSAAARIPGLPIQGSRRRPSFLSEVDGAGRKAREDRRVRACT